MANPKISEETREKLEDAAVSVFMEQYAKALDAGMNKELEACVEDAFPLELEKRCRALIQKEYAKERCRKRRKNALRVLRSAAVVAVALLSLCSVLFVTVEAFRLPVMNFFVQKTERYWQLSGQQNTDTIPEVFNPKDPLGGIIPDEFVLTNLFGSWVEGHINADYVKDDNTMISFIVTQTMNNAQVDTEEASAKPYSVLGHDAIMSVEGEFVRITWLDEEDARIITLFATNVSEEMVELYAETVATLLG